MRLYREMRMWRHEDLVQRMASAQERAQAADARLRAEYDSSNRELYRRARIIFMTTAAVAKHQHLIKTLGVKAS